MKPGLYDDVPENEYHAGPELSSTGAKAIVKCPKLFRHERDHRTNTAAFDEGHAFHRLVLGAGNDFTVVEGNRNAKAVKQEIEDAEAAGLVVLKPDQSIMVHNMADAVANDKAARDLFERGAPEQSAYALDPATWTPIRARFDWLTEDDEGPVIVDLKSTAGSTHPWELGKTIGDFGYHQQAAFYIDALALLGQPGARFKFVFVSKKAPHEVRVVTLPERAVERGRELNARALDLFSQCTARNEWPCLHGTEQVVDIPAYLYND